MSLTLYYHPLASFCWKVLIALYEAETPFAREVVDLGDKASRSRFLAIWPMGKMPVLVDAARGETIPETSIIIEYLARHQPGAATLLPTEPELALQTRLRDRFYDLYVQEPMQKIVTDRLRPAGANDGFGVEAARAQLRTSYELVETQMAGRTWAVGETFTLADCAAAPALYYANRVEPFGAMRPNAAAYLERLLARPSVARTVAEAQPYFALFPA
jgi:glutathione S-transferase